jgi:hypothetical protein
MKFHENRDMRKDGERNIVGNREMSAILLCK